MGGYGRLQNVLLEQTHSLLPGGNVYITPCSRDATFPTA